MCEFELLRDIVNVGLNAFRRVKIDLCDKNLLVHESVGDGLMI